MASNRLLKFTLAACAAAVLAGCATAPAPAPQPASTPMAAGPVRVKVIAINDFHGNLMPPLGGIRTPDPAQPGKFITVPAGGAEHLATAIAAAKAENPNHAVVAAGDLIGASPLLSALFRDEPSVESLSLMGLQIAAVGNHEFDKGAGELLRMQRGGCHPNEGCKGPKPFEGAKYMYLAASTVVQATGQTLFPAYTVQRYEGIPVAFIGLTLEGTPGIVTPEGVKGLRFRDEAETINELVPQLQQQGVEAIVVLIHEGGTPTGGYNECPGISGAIVGITERLNPAVDVVVSGHTHRAYNCRIAGKLVTSADSYGRMLSEIDLTLDPATRDVTKAVADNVIVATQSFAKDPRQTALIAAYEAVARPLAERLVGRLAAPLTRETNPAGENSIGQVVADAQLYATRAAGAQVALMNPGGLRSDLVPGPGGVLRYQDLFAVQPFNNNLVTMTLTGAQFLALMEGNLRGREPRPLKVSQGLSYTWDARQPVGQRLVPGSVKINGRVVQPGDSVRVTVNSFIASGGDGYSVFNEGTERVTGVMDIDALEAYVKSQPQVVVPPLDRIQRLN
jgi:5'-nucleotidase